MFPVYKLKIKKDNWQANKKTRKNIIRKDNSNKTNCTHFLSRWYKQEYLRQHLKNVKPVLYEEKTSIIEFQAQKKESDPKDQSNPTKEQKYIQTTKEEINDDKLVITTSEHNMECNRTLLKKQTIRSKGYYVLDTNT